MTSGYQLNEENDNERTTTSAASVTAATSAADTQVDSVGSGGCDIAEHIRKFVFTNQRASPSETGVAAEPVENLEIQIPEVNIHIS